MSEIPPVSGAADLAERFAAAVDAAFADDGPLARTLAAFEPRPSQRRMAAAVARVFAQGGILLAEAGTGTGKTLAYLVPAVLSRQRVLVSTGTKNLQEQVFYKDLPVLRDALGVPFTATYMKGRANYLCWYRFDRWRERPGPRPPGEERLVAILSEWAAVTETGDRAELEDLPEDSPVWADLSATNETCLGRECPRYDDCFVTQMRRRAAESDLVIVNHHLLCADAAVRQSAYGEVIPACRFAVLDEAHQLEDVATQYFGLTVSTYRLLELVRDGERALAGLPEPRRAAELAGHLARVREASQRFFQTLVLQLADGLEAETSGSPRDARAAGALRPATERAGGGGPAGLWVAEAADGAPERRVRLNPARLAPVAPDATAVVEALEAVRAAVERLSGASEELTAIGRRAGEMADELRFLVRADDPAYVFFLEVRGRGVFLRAAPVDVSGIVRRELLARFDATVLTSATLAVDGSFAYLRSRLGVERAEEIRLPSEFDYGRQAILYLPRHLPDPRSPRFAAAAAREIVEILGRTEGRAFVLFTSYANLREVERVVTWALPYPILVQGSAPRSALLREFRATPHAVLLATASFWQGVDVVGEALSCVIIDKLPFASPADPITAARIDAVAARGGRPFVDYQVPLAILILLQGLGRLIRHRTDRGVLAILDPRLHTRRYGARFLAALPPAPVVTDLDSIARFFGAAPAGP